MSISNEIRHDDRAVRARRRCHAQTPPPTKSLSASVGVVAFPAKGQDATEAKPG